MAQTVIWSQEALGDIDSIAEYIGRDSIYYAQHVVELCYCYNTQTRAKYQEVGDVTNN